MARASESLRSAGADVNLLIPKSPPARFIPRHSILYASMHSDQQPYRDLYDDMLRYEGAALYDDLLRPWLAAHDGERRWLAELRARPGNPLPAVQTEESWRLYALSRIVQLLELSFAPRTSDPAWNVAPVGREEFDGFMTALGMEPIEQSSFHPFFHEIVTVDQLPEENASPEIAEVYWPGYMLGPLLVSRAGCRVQAGRSHLLKEVAEHSTLYWAFARNNRPTADLSMGWGGNSQWRTSFRRDYALDGELHYNVDARPHPGGQDDEDLNAGERMELLRHRCFVTCTKPGDDRWPYDLSFIEDV